MAGGGDAADVVTAAGADACFHGSDAAVAGGAGDRFDRRPTQQAGALFICGTRSRQGACSAVGRSVQDKSSGSVVLAGAPERVRLTRWSRVDEGGQGRAAGPPVGAALTARSVVAVTMSWGARLRAPTCRLHSWRGPSFPV